MVKHALFTFIILLFPLSGVAQDYSHCDGADVTPSDHGSLTLGVSADSTERSNNAAAINAAIANAPVEGTVCLPDDSLYTTWDTTPGDPGIIRITRDSITVEGAGACGWGSLGGCTFIGTPGNQGISDTLTAGNIGHKYPRLDENNNDLHRGDGVSFEVDGQTAKEIHIKGMMLSTGLDHTGCYNFGSLSDQIYCWDRGNKGIDFRNTNGSNDLIELTDVQFRGYRGEVIYHGGLGMQTITANRLWAHESNASLWNVPAADSQVVKNSRFGPDSRFWAEMQAELYPDAYSMHRDNEYLQCRTVSGCIAIAADTESNSVDGMVFKYRNNDFDLGDRRLFFLERANYTLRVDSSDATGADPFVRFTGGFSETGDIQIHDNYIESPNDVTEMPNGGYAGSITRNTFDGGTVMKMVGGGNNQGLLYAGNVVKGSMTGFEGGGLNSFEGPETRNNIFDGGGGHSQFHSVSSSIHMAAQNMEPFGNGDPFELDTLTAVDGAIYEIRDGFGGRTVNLPADSVQHGWTTDKSIPDDNRFIVQYDETNEVFNAVGWQRPLDSLSEASGWNSGSIAGPDTITGPGSAAGASQDNGYFRHRAMAQDADISGTYGVKAEIDSVDQGDISPFGSAVVRLADADSTGANRIQVECARFGYCRVTWRKGGTLNKGNWQRIDPRFVRVLTDGTEAWVEHDNDLNGQWEGMPLDNDGYTTGDDRVTIDLSATPHAGVGVVSQDSQTDMTAIIQDVGIISLN